MSYWMREYKKALKRNELLKRRLSNLRRACRNSGRSSLSRVVSREEVAEANEEMLFADSFEDALIGWVERFGMSPVALYDREKCIAVLMKRDGMSQEDAEEFFCFNVIGSWMGDNTPAFAVLAGTRKTGSR